MFLSVFCFRQPKYLQRASGTQAALTQCCPPPAWLVPVVFSSDPSFCISSPLVLNDQSKHSPLQAFVPTLPLSRMLLLMGLILPDLLGYPLVWEVPPPHEFSLLFPHWVAMVCLEGMW